MTEQNFMIFADVSPRAQAIENAKSFIEFHELTEKDVKIAARDDMVCVITKHENTHLKKGFTEWLMLKQQSSMPA